MIERTARSVLGSTTLRLTKIESLKAQFERGAVAEGPRMTPPGRQE
jgi:hypothetical protein